MENFFSNNVLFEDTDDVITFITNIINEKKQFSIIDYIDEPIGKTELTEYLINHKKENSIIDKTIIQSIVSKLKPEDVNRCYYKNQIIPLLENSWFKAKLQQILQYQYTDKPAEEMTEPLNEFREKILDFCFYDYLYEDRYKRAMKDKRKTIITIDTDCLKRRIH